jgi:hypothetical protein
MFKKKSTAASRLIQEAESHIGYTANQSVADMFSSAVGKPGIPWAGPFIDVCAKKAGLHLPSFISTASALASFIKTNRTFQDPRPGDIVFFQTASDSNLGQPHVGIVTDVSHYKTHGLFQCIEGQTDSGTPKGLSTRNGVYRRNRYAYDVLAFARPNFERAELEASRISDPGELLTNVKVPVIQGPSIKLGMKHPYVALIQVALSMTVGLKSAPRGEFDHKTRAAFANFQRSLGYIGDAASGVPDVNSLRVLAKLTGVFRVVE